jgi:MFS family permease
MLAAIIFDVVIVAVMVWCGRFTARYAEQRGRSRRPWFLLGALFFPIPSIVLALLPPRGDLTLWRIFRSNHNW